jgi:hypothetical protein
MKLTRLKFALALAAICALAVVVPASANTITFTLTQDGCSGTCGSAPFGTVVISDNGSGTAAFVTVLETLKTGERFAGTGAGDALEFNVLGAVTITNPTIGFVVGPAPDTASTFGTFLQSVRCTSCTGGGAGNPTGPLSFNVGSATGVTTANFIANAGGFFFASDIVGNNGNTGNVAAQGGGGSVSGGAPEPMSMFLMGGGLLGVGLVGKLRKS